MIGGITKALEASEKQMLIDAKSPAPERERVHEGRERA